MSASLWQIQVLVILAGLSCLRFWVAAFRINRGVIVGRFNVFAFATLALFVAAVL